MLERLKKMYALLTRREKALLPLLMAVLLVNSALESVSIGLLLPLLMVVSDATEALKNPYLAYVYGLTGLREPDHFIYVMGAAVVVVLAFKNIAGLAISAWNYRVGQQIGAALSTRLFAKYMYAPYSWHAQNNSAEMIRNADGAVNQTVSGVIIPTLAVVNETLIVFGIVLMLVLVDPLGSLAIGLFIGLLGFAIHRFTRQHNTRAGKNVLDAHGGILKTMQQGVGAIKEIRILGREQSVVDQYRSQREVMAHWRTVAGTLQLMPRYVLETALAFAVIALLSAMVYFRGAETAIPVLGLIAAAALRIMPSANRVLSSLQQMRAGWHAVDLVADDSHILDSLAAGSSADAGGPGTAKAQPGEPGAASGIELRHVTFRYPERAESAVEDISLAIGWGESMGFVGASGAGKTTLIDVVIGLLQPQQGQVLVDGRDIGGDRHAWQRRIGYVPQNVYLVDDTLARNIALGLDPSQIDEARLRETVRLACLEDFLRDIPGGFDARLGEKGVRISGGQRQRVGIARALYRNPDVLVLDEATASVDTATEAQLSEVISQMAGRKTVLVVAHRLSTVRSCDRIALMAAGRIADIGPFDELAARNKQFARMVSLANVQHGVLAQ